MTISTFNNRTNTFNNRANTFKKEKLKKDLKINKELKKHKYLPIMFGGTKIVDYKEKYIEILKELKFYNKKYEKQNYKVSKYENAINILKDFNEELTSSSQLKNIPNIGKAMIDKLDELIKTNKVKKL